MEIFIKVIPHIMSDEDLEVIIEEFSTTQFQFEELLKKNTEAHQELFNRVDLRISKDNQEDEDKKESTLKNKDDLIDYELLNSYNGEVSQNLVEKMFYFGRYLLICSSTIDGWPANLQGKWNGYYYPAWSSDYHNDENIQMNYWAALPGNLAEMTKSYFDFYPRLSR